MIWHAGTHEPVKRSVHATLGAMAIVCLGYNVLAWGARREGHLAINVGLYTALVWWEHRAVRSHQLGNKQVSTTTTISRAAARLDSSLDRISAKSASRCA